MTIRLLAKRDGQGAWAARHLLMVTRHDPDTRVEIIRVRREETPPWRGPVDVLLSYLSPWVVPVRCLADSRLALNFHPGPPEYPGIGCTNYAVYDGVTTYGVTVHHMAKAVDAGPILAVERFPVAAEATVVTVTTQAYTALRSLFVIVVDLIRQGTPFPTCAERWCRPAGTRTQFLAWLDQELSPDPVERERRRRAMIFPGYPVPRGCGESVAV